MLLVEPADNIGGGAPGDCTDVMRALMKHDVPGAGVVIADARGGPGAGARAGGRPCHHRHRRQGQPAGSGAGDAWRSNWSRAVTGALSWKTSKARSWCWAGRSTWAQSAVVRHRGLTILLTSKRLAPMDLGQWRSQGIDPEKLSVIGVKAAVGHRRAYDPIASASFTVRTRGPCTSDLKQLPYKRIRRPVYPLDFADGKSWTTVAGLDWPQTKEWGDRHDPSPSCVCGSSGLDVARLAASAQTPLRPPACRHCPS